ncbi:MAG: hypothetical protein QM803_08895 [Rhodocyclaceae bacterium]
MQSLTLEAVADFLEVANIESSQDMGFAVIHTGLSSFGERFVLVNDYRGHSVITGPLESFQSLSGATELKQ